MKRLVFPIAALLFAPAVPASAADPDVFEQKIRPVLVEKCYTCHSAEAEKKGKLKGGMLLDTRDGMRKGGDAGPAVVAGKPESGTLLKALRYDGDLKMPPKEKLPDAVIKDFEAWVKSGADDPRTVETGKQ